MTSVGIMAAGVHLSAGPCTAVLDEPFNNLTAWTGTSGSSIVAGRNGNAVSHTGGADLIHTIATGDRSNDVTIGFAWRTSSVGTITRNVLRLRQADTTVLCLLAVTTTGAVTFGIGDGARILFTSAASVVAANTWYYFELQIHMADTGGSYTLRMNNTVLATATGIDTMAEPSATGPVALVYLPNISGATTMVDDLYLTTGAGCSLQGDHAIP